ncbi:MAG: hypothetical protein NT004_08850 [Bacteroidetes bacterium]|nr:hypothetical protein [Bacteroidota bacterium]
MENMSENNTSIIPIGSTGLTRVNCAITITDKILKEHNFKLHNHKNLLTDNWDEHFPDEWKKVLELHIILTKLEIQVDTKISIYDQYKSIFNVEYTFKNKTDYKHLKSLKILNLHEINGISDLQPISYFENLIELRWISYSETIMGIENIGSLSKLKYLDFHEPHLFELDFLKTNIELKCLKLLTGYISDFSFLSELQKLECLTFYSDKISVSHPIFKLPRLKNLNIVGCRKVEDVELFSNLSELVNLNLHRVNIKDIDFVKKLKLKSLSIRNGGLSNEDITWLRENIQDLSL